MATYDDHLRLVGKRVGDFLLVLIELLSLDRTAEALRAIIDTYYNIAREFSVSRHLPGGASFN